MTDHATTERRHWLQNMQRNEARLSKWRLKMWLSGRSKPAPVDNNIIDFVDVLIERAKK